MEVLKLLRLDRNSEKHQKFLNDREWAMCKYANSIYSVYARPSSTKINIAREIENRLHSVFYHGGSSFSFTCSGYDIEGNLIIMTRCNTYKII